MSTKLFVGNLSFNTTENDLHDAFSAHGTVVETNLMVDRNTGRSRGFAFVEYATSEEANRAVEMFHNKDFQGLVDHGSITLGSLIYSMKPGQDSAGLCPSTNSVMIHRTSRTVKAYKGANQP